LPRLVAVGLAARVAGIPIATATIKANPATRAAAPFLIPIVADVLLLATRPHSPPAAVDGDIDCFFTLFQQES